MVFYSELERELMNIFYNLDDPVRETIAKDYLCQAKKILRKSPRLRRKWGSAVRCYAKENNIDYNGVN